MVKKPVCPKEHRALRVSFFKTIAKKAARPEDSAILQRTLMQYAV